MAEEIKKVVEQTETAVVLDNNSAEKVIESTTIIQEKVETNTKRFLSEKGLNNLMIMFFSTLLTLLCLLPIGYLLTKKIPTSPPHRRLRNSANVLSCFADTSPPHRRLRKDGAALSHPSYFFTATQAA